MELEHNIMSIHLPENKKRKGMLTFGGGPSRTDHRIPFSQQMASPELTYAWKVDLSSILIKGSIDQPALPLNSVAAITLDPEYALAISPEATQIVWEYLGATPDEDGAHIDCDTRESLPEIVLMLGKEYITLGWEDYTAHWWLDPDNVCRVLVVDCDVEGSAMLGLPLMKKFDLSFDMDNNELGCMSRHLLLWKTLRC